MHTFPHEVKIVRSDARGQNGAAQIAKGAAVAYARPAFSKSRVTKAGEALAALGAEVPDEDLDVVHNWRVSHSYPLHAIKTTLKGRAKRVDPSALISHRLKRLTSIRAKLIRGQTRSIRLVQMQDIGGCRAVVSDIHAVDKLVTLFRVGFSKNPTRHKLLGEVDDYVTHPKEDGYRSVHCAILYRSVSKARACYNDMRIEVQIRSRLQHAWATAVETVDVITNQSLKFALNSETGNPDWKRFFALMGNEIATREGRPPVPGCPAARPQSRNELARLASKLKVEQILRGVTEAIRVIGERPADNSQEYVITLDTSARTVRINGFSKENRADAEALTISIEKQGQPHLQVVQVSVENMRNLREAYPNYYLDTKEFLAALRLAISFDRVNKALRKRKNHLQVPLPLDEPLK